MDNEQKIIGRIIQVSKEGYGFISSREIEFVKIFFHWTALKQDTKKFKELKTGMYVEFTPLDVRPRGWRAIHIRVIPKPAAEVLGLPDDEELDKEIQAASGE